MTSSAAVSLIGPLWVLGGTRDAQCDTLPSTVW
jgi:hypothetical protein